MYKNNYDAVEFGKRIKKVRRKNGMTQEQLADALYLSVDSVSRIETGKGMCMPEHLVHICELFNVSSDYLYFGGVETLYGRMQEGKAPLKNINDMLSECTDDEVQRLEQMIKLFLGK